LLSAEVCHSLPQSAQAEADTEAEADHFRRIETTTDIEVLTDAVTRAREENPGTALQPVWKTNGISRHSPNSLVSPAHKRCHPAAAAACARGICIPAFLVGQWIAQLDPEQQSPPTAELALSGFVTDVVRALPDGPVGDDPLRFWRAAWEHTNPSRAPVKRKLTKSEQNIETAMRVRESRLARGIVD
jgi:hypothetical protein